MQFATEIVSSTPRADCSGCGVKTIAVPWAGKNSRFTLLFEAFAIQVLQACRSVKDASTLLGIDWKSANRIMQMAVERGLAHRQTNQIVQVGIDEKSFGKGQDYVSLMCDLKESRVLEVVPDRNRDAADLLWKSLPAEQRGRMQSVGMDMWKPFMAATQAHAPQAAIVHDKYHIAAPLGYAVDLVRRQEHKASSAQGDDTLKGTRYPWLCGFENIAKERQAEFAQLRQIAEKTARAWTIKEMFREFWDTSYEANARKFFKQWYAWASRCQLKPMVKAAKMIHTHFHHIITYFRHRITNAATEGLNSQIQGLKSAARGFRNFASYRVRILFFCGKLDLLPVK